MNTAEVTSASVQGGSGDDDDVVMLSDDDTGHTTSRNGERHAQRPESSPDSCAAKMAAAGDRDVDDVVFEDEVVPVAYHRFSWAEPLFEGYIPGTYCVVYGQGLWRWTVGV